MIKTSGGFLIAQIQRAGGRVFEGILRDCGIDAFSGPQGRILYVLWEKGRLTIGEIGRMTSLAKATLTGMLDRMEEGGLIERIPDPRSRRRVYVAITEKARAYREAYDEVSERANEVFYRGFAEEEIVFFEDTLRRILRNLEEEEGGSRS